MVGRSGPELDQLVVGGEVDAKKLRAGVELAFCHAAEPQEANKLSKNVP